jgi:hypothetical protein
LVRHKVKLTKKDKEAMATIDDCYRNSQRFDRERIDNLDLYEGRRRRRDSNASRFDHVYRSHIGGRVVEQMATFVAQALTNEGENVFRVADYNNIDVAREAAATTHLLNYYMRNFDLTEQVYLAAWEAELYGTGILEVEYKTTYIEEPDPDTRLQILKDEEGNFGAELPTKYIRKPDKQQPFVRHVRLKDFWVDSGATSMHDLRKACVREVMNFLDVKASKERYGLKNLDVAKEAGFPEKRLRTGATSSRNRTDGHRRREHGIDADNIETYNNSKTGKENPKVELVKIYEPGTVQFVMNGIVISEKIRLYPGIQFPFRALRNDPKPGEFYGRSTIELIGNDIEFNEELVSLIFDRQLQNLKPIFLADSGAFTNSQLDEFKKAGPGDIISVLGLNVEAIREIKAEAPDQSAIAFAQKFEQDAKNAAALNPLMDGGQDLSSGVRTQGSFELVSRLGSTRVQNKIKLYAKAFEDIGQIVLQMAKIFSNKEEYLSVAGAVGDTYQQFAVDPRNIDTRMKFKVKIGQIADPARQTKMAQQLNWLSTAAQLDPLGIVRIYKGLAEAAATGDLFEDSVGLLETDPEVIAARAELMSQSAGLAGPSSISQLGSPSSMQPPQQPQQQDPNAQPQPAQASSIPTALEGN